MNEALQRALQLLFANDAFLLEANVKERAIAAKLACYLALQFPEHDVDIEYNRHGLEPKRVNLPAHCRGGGDKLILPDVVIHRRGNDQHNVLVIQVKKQTNPEPRDCDRAIIEAMIQDFEYAHGLLIDLPTGPGARDRKPLLEWL
jgi:hypothetical protein